MSELMQPECQALIEELRRLTAERDRLLGICRCVSGYAERKHGRWSVPASVVAACDKAIGCRWKDGKLVAEEAKAHSQPAVGHGTQTETALPDKPAVAPEQGSSSASSASLR